MADTTNHYAPDYATPPGETLLETIEYLGMSQAELAERTGRPKKTINEIIKGKALITPETAQQLELVLGIPASFWNNAERNYRQFLAQQKQEQFLEQHQDWMQGFPVAAMLNMGWIPQAKRPTEKLRGILQFFGIASPEQWQTVWGAPKVAYRKTRAHTQQPNDNAAKINSVWLRKGELQAHAIQCAPYNRQRFKQALQTIRTLTPEPLNDCFPKIQKLCADAGVAFVLVPELPTSRACGATHWLTSGKAILQLSLRHKSDDHFWFSFFHEAGHILLHGKTTFIDFEDNSQRSSEQEQQANTFATDFLIPPEEFQQCIGTPNFRSKQNIAEFAQHIGIAPGIVVGRLQHDGYIPYRNCNGLKKKLAWGENNQVIHPAQKEVAE
ncbi:MAG: ImmA/IrrE family metallo-endopeptidase [Candidatus Kapabacteria bacterium]|nr:ImmA/IrrE family metallo-endopeptidase [Candidatus Kapabacteria bacterium]